jgi:hypothetical protein
MDSIFEDQAKELMTKERAEFVRKLRVDEKNTWRGVAGECNDQWKGDWGSNQIMGMELCAAAAKFFDENYMKEPWN